MSEVLTAPHVLTFAYTRSTGPVIGAFLTGLRDRTVFGIRVGDGRVVVPPQEYDPVTSQPLTVDDLVEVAAVGEVVTWAWVPEPRPGQPFDRPFAYVLVRLDGADTPILHALDVPAPKDVSTGMRVRIRWAAEPTGHIGDIACFEPVAGDAPAASDEPGAPGAVQDAPPADPVTVVTTPVEVALTYHPGPVEEAFLRGTQERRLLARQCSKCAKVYLPPRGVCSMCGTAFTDEIIEIGEPGNQVGTIATFAVVNVPFAGREVDLPYAAVEVLWDGAHITSQFLFRGAPLEDVRMGGRVRAVWKDGDLEPTLSNVTHVVPIDEPDAPFDTYAEYV